MTDHVTRRRFLKNSLYAAGTMATVAPSLVRAKSANSKLGFAHIGVSGRGGAHLGYSKGHNCVALCDADDGTGKTGRAGGVAGVRRRFAKAEFFTDYRKMYDKLEKDIDVVIVSTPDHQHAPAGMRALVRGKHVYCEKPLTYSIEEARMMAEETAKRKVATQMGNQGHANNGNRAVVEWVRAGAIGEVQEVHTWTNRPVWPQGITKAPEGRDVPKGLDWDAWLGPAEDRKYWPGLHPFNWRGWLDFGAGAIGDMGCHTWDCVWWSMAPEAPLSAEVIKATPDPATNQYTFPRQAIYKWEFGKTESRPGFVAYWYEGGLKPDVPEEMKNDPKRPDSAKQLGGSGSLFIGTKGKLYVVGDYGNSPRLIPEAAMGEFFGGVKNGTIKVDKIPPSPGHASEFLMACTGEEPWDFPKSNFLYAGPLVEAMSLANVALRVGKKVEWDAKKMKCPNAPEADQFIKRSYRKGWELVG